MSFSLNKLSVNTSSKSYLYSPCHGMRCNAMQLINLAT